MNLVKLTTAEISRALLRILALSINQQMLLKTGALDEYDHLAMV